MLAYFEKHLVFNQVDEEEVNGNNVNMTGVDDEDDI
jgi:chromobox protein 1